MNEGKNIERLEAAVKKLLAMVSFLKEKNRDALARIQEMEEANSNRDVELERMAEERNELLARVDQLISEIDAAMESSASVDEAAKSAETPQGTLNLST